MAMLSEFLGSDAIGFTAYETLEAFLHAQCQPRELCAARLSLASNIWFEKVVVGQGWKTK